jgi:hypothetical protein
MPPHFVHGRLLPWLWLAAKTSDCHPKHPIAIGSQAAPLGKKRLLLSQLKPGSIVYSGGHDIAIAYGSDLTEPLVARGPVVARVSNDFLGELYEAGRRVWNAQFITHQLQTITLKRKDV